MKKIIGEYHLFNKNGENGIEKTKDMDLATEICFVGMLIEVLAHNNGVPNDKMAEILLDGIEKYPMTFKEESR